MPRFSIIIVNYNAGALLQAAVDSLAAQTRQDFELIVIDNASEDGSAQALDVSKLASAQVVCNDDNLGFAAANNQAARLASAPWLVLLNPDAYAEPDWLETLDLAARRFPQYQMFTSAQIDATNPALMDGAGDAYHLFGFPWRGGYGRTIEEMPETGLCFSGCGAGVMVRRDLFLELGGFDERFFCYCEDVDFGYRAQLAGQDCVFVREAVIYHHGSAVSGPSSPFTIYHGTRNRLWTYCKNTPPLLLLLTLPGHITISVYLLVRSASIGRFEATAKGMKDGVAGALRLRRGQQWSPPSRQIPLFELARRMAWSPFRMRARKPHLRPLPRETRA